MADTLSHTEFETRQQAWRTFEVHSEYILHVFAPNTLIIWVPLVRHSFLIVFFLDSNFRPEDGNQDAPLYNGYLFQRGREQRRNPQPQPQPQPAYPPYTYYLTGNPRIPLQYVPQAAMQSHSLFNRNSVTHSSVLSHYCWHYQPTDILKSSQRH